jgi:cytochrome c oxidase subunit 4
MDNTQHTVEHAHGEHGETMTKSKIWQVFFYLLAITTLEFIIALYLRPHNLVSHGLANTAYIVLTLVKAFYIVAYFMHLGFEKIALRTTIITVFIFIIYFIVLMLTEGSYLHIHMSHVI